MKKLFVLILVIGLLTFGITFAEGITPAMFMASRGLIVIDENQLTSMGGETNDADFDFTFAGFSIDESTSTASIYWNDGNGFNVAMDMAAMLGNATLDTKTIANTFLDFCEEYPDFEAYACGSDDSFVYTKDTDILEKFLDESEVMPSEMYDSIDEFYAAVKIYSGLETDTMDDAANELSINDIDWGKLTDAEISSLIEAGQSELKKRHPVDVQSTDSYLIMDYNGFTVTATNFRVEESYSYKNGALTCDVVLDNSTETNYGLSGTDICINGWTVEGSVFAEVKAGKKLKDEFSLDLAGANISSLDEVEEIEFVFNVWDDDYNYYNSDPVIVSFK